MAVGPLSFSDMPATTSPAFQGGPPVGSDPYCIAPGGAEELSMLPVPGFAAKANQVRGWLLAPCPGVGWATNRREQQI